MEWRLSAETVPHVSTFEYHRDRERAPHLEQRPHRDRLYMAAAFLREVAEEPGVDTWSDLGCGDGGLLSLVQDSFPGSSWGYDFSPANAAGWPERGVRAQALDVFGADWHQVQMGDVVSMTEVLEHLADPHGVLAWVGGHTTHLVCSSPWNETSAGHSDCHAWAWDREGYAAMITGAGWIIDRHQDAGLFQVVSAHR